MKDFYDKFVIDGILVCMYGVIKIMCNRLVYL